MHREYNVGTRLEQNSEYKTKKTDWRTHGRTQPRLGEPMHGVSAALDLVFQHKKWNEKMKCEELARNRHRLWTRPQTGLVEFESCHRPAIRLKLLVNYNFTFVLLGQLRYMTSSLWGFCVLTKDTSTCGRESNHWAWGPQTRSNNWSTCCS